MIRRRDRFLPFVSDWFPLLVELRYYWMRSNEWENHIDAEFVLLPYEGRVTLTFQGAPFSVEMVDGGLNRFYRSVAKALHDTHGWDWGVAVIPRIEPEWGLKREILIAVHEEDSKKQKEK